MKNKKNKLVTELVKSILVYSKNDSDKNYAMIIRNEIMLLENFYKKLLTDDTVHEKVKIAIKPRIKELNNEEDYYNKFIEDENNAIEFVEFCKKIIEIK